MTKPISPVSAVRAVGQEILTEPDPRHECVRIVAVGISDIAEAEYVQLRFTVTASDIYGEEDRPCYAAANEAHKDDHPKEANEEIAIERVVTENIAIVSLAEGFNPS